MVDVIRVVTGFLKENCYIIHNGIDCLVIDPGSDQEKILTEINKKGLKVKGILITHYHFDHIGALQDILDYKNVPIYDYKSINKEVNIEKFNFRIINFPGHKEDLVGFLFDNKLFSGDFIFEGTIGRTDLPGGNYKEMQESIKKILSFKNDLQIYPGHGQSTNLSKERKNLNSYL